MKKCAEWIIPALQKRFDELNERIEKGVLVQKERDAADQFLSKLKDSLTVDQLKLLNHWEDQITFAIAREKEGLYRYGLMDGIHISASLVSTELLCP